MNTQTENKTTSAYQNWFNGLSKEAKEFFTEMKSGDNIEVLCHSSKNNNETWMRGIFNNRIAATDRLYRINVTLEDGTEINGVAPECVRLA